MPRPDPPLIRHTPPIGPRTVTGFRRVTVPLKLRSRAGWGPGTVVAVSVDEVGVEWIRLGTPRADDPAGAVLRTLSAVGQVTLPAAMLARTGLDLFARVYFIGAKELSDTVWVLPERWVGLVGAAA